MITQKQAVTNAVLSVFPDYEMNGETILSDILTRESKVEIRAILFAGFKAGGITFENRALLADDAYVSKYVTGLLDNWIRKNPEFNNGAKYETKNPGSRSGSQDETIKALRNLMKCVEGETKAEVQKAINERMAEIKPESTVTINVDALPAHLRHLVS
jgi:hypothetical protein